MNECKGMGRAIWLDVRMLRCEEAEEAYALHKLTLQVVSKVTTWQTLNHKQWQEIGRYRCLECSLLMRH